MTASPTTGHDPAGAHRRSRVGILIVAYNAVGTLTKVLNRIPAAVWDSVEEVVVFDDASQDATYEVGVGYKTVSGNAKLTVLSHRTNLGYGGNQKAGYQYFIDKGFDAVVLLHGDGQYAPEMLAEMYGPIVRGEADAVFGSRMMKEHGGALKGGMPLYKYVGNRILTTIENRALRMRLTEFHSGYRAYSLHALREIDFTQMTNDFHFDTEIIIKLNHQRFRIVEIPIPTYYGDELCYVDGMKYARHVVRALYRYKTTTRSIRRFPEFREYFVHYPLKHTKHSSHYYFQKHIGQRQAVLDLGCGEGFFAEHIAGQGNEVVGVDMLDGPARRDALQHYVKADLGGGLGAVRAQLRGQLFDRVLLQDILEHLPVPESLLRDCHSVLSRHGQVLVSVPNVANITVRLGLLMGRFTYTERGILDKTHLRFFTRHSARRLLAETGFEIVHEEVTVIPFEIVLGLSADSRIARVLNRILALFTRWMPGLLAYQLVFVARPTPAAA